MREVIIITGPTCVGKTALSLKLAEECGGEIISCDSVQVYRHADIGSAKPDAAELARVKHHLIDVAEPSEVFDVARYVELAKAAFDDISARGKKAVVVGGSGFYLKSWFCAVADNVMIPPEIRAFTEDLERVGGAVALARELLKVDPNAASALDINNPRRTKNALERCLVTGKSVMRLREDFAALPCPMGDDFSRRVIRLNLPDNELLERIKLRTHKMFEDGLIDETKKLIELGIERNPPLRNSVGYKQVIEFIKSGASDVGKLEADIIKQTQSLVRKQLKTAKTSEGASIAK